MKRDEDNNKSLNSLGWSKEFNFDAQEQESLARVIAINRSHLRAITLNGEINIHHSDISKHAAVGDWVVTNPFFVDEQGEVAALIKELVPRKSKFSRASAGDRLKEQVIAANVDTVFVVTSINQDFNLNRLKRYLLLIKKGLAKPVIILSKVDLNSLYEEFIKNFKEKLDEDVLVQPLSLISDIGVKEIKKLIPEGETSVFVGSSGVGKSSLVNSLLGEEKQVVGEIRGFDDKGRHTTTTRQMFFIPSGGMIIDTPGVRDVSVFGDEGFLSDKFEDVEELILKCKFSDCNHKNEPGCAINKALKTDELMQERWIKYQKLINEKPEVNTSYKSRKKKR